MEESNQPGKRTYANYQVSLKILLRKGSEFLFLTDTFGDRFDLPGGRIDNVEHDIPLTEIIARETTEELGKDVIYKLGKPIFQFRRHFDDEGLYIFLVVYEAEYISGDIRLSAEHLNFRWVNPTNIGLKEKDFFSREEYLAFKN